MTKAMRAALLGGAICGTVWSGCAFAQVSDAAPAASDEIIVRGVRASIEGALATKRDSREFVDALVAEDIAQFPDSNLGEALQRIPGITVDRSEGADQSNAVGEGGTINVRGLGPDFTRTEINGMTATTPGQGRGFGFNVLASELFTRAQVSKSLTAQDNEGGLAGTVKLRTYRAFDFDRAMLSASARGTYATGSEVLTPGGTVIAARRFAGGKLGVALGINFDRTAPYDVSVDALNWDKVSDMYGANFAKLPADVRSRLQNVEMPRGPRIIENDRRQDRFNATLSLQAQPTDRLTVSFDNIFARVRHRGVQNRQGLSLLKSFTTAPGDLVVDDNRLVSARFDSGDPVSSLTNYDYDVRSSLYQGTLSADWSPTDRLTLTPGAGYAFAEERYLKWNQITLLSAVAPVVIGSQGDFTYYRSGAGDQADPAIYTRLYSIRNRPDRDQDQEYSGWLDGRWSFGSKGLQSIEFGARWSRRDKRFDAYDGIGSTATSITDFRPYIIVRDFAFGDVPAGFPKQILGIDFDALHVATGTDRLVAPRLDESSYKVTEETVAGYAMAKFSLGPVVGDAGVRIVHTDQVSAGVQRVVAADNSYKLVPAEFAHNYTYALPSLNLRWDVAGGLVARFAAYRSLTRPALTDIQPSRRLPNFDGGNGTSGNPMLDPFTATNIDVGAEWYFMKGGLLNAAYFRKDLSGLIESVTDEVQVVDPISGKQLNVFLSRPVQGDGADVEGLELGFQTPFFFLPGFLRNAGGMVNATFTRSHANFRNEADIRATSLPGLSKRSYNAVLYYEDQRFSTRLAYNWRGRYLLQASGSGGEPVSRDAYGQLDLGASYRVGRNIALHFDALNLTRARIRSCSSLDTDLVKGVLDAGRKFKFSITFRN